MKKILLFIILNITVTVFANCPQPNYCQRSCWDPNGLHPAQSNPSYTNVTHIIVHHTGDGIVFPPSTSYADKVRYYWDLHVNTRGWSDIGYNWLIDRNGVVYEGRGDGVLGAHFSGMNTGTMGVALIGDFTLENPSTSAINSLKNLIAWEAKDKSINVTGTSYHASSGLNLNTVSGHMDGIATSCPGTNLYSQLSSIRSDVSAFPCYSGNANLDCSNAITLTCGVMYSGGSSSVSSAVGTYGCNSWTETGPERVHTITPSADGTITATISNFSGDLDVYILGSCDPSDCLGSVASSSATYNNAQAGQTYYIVVDADDGSGSSYDLIVDCPVPNTSEDITVSNASVNLSSVIAGGTIEVSVDHNYSGVQLDSELPSFDVDYYLSTDCTLSSDDILLGGDTSSLGSDDPSHSETEDVIIPEGTIAGTYYIIFSGDNDNELGEVNEVNNTACVPITVEDNANGEEDITVTNATVTISVVEVGGTIEVSADQNYSGAQLNSELPSFDLDYYLSTDCTLSSDDVLLGGDSSSLGSDDPYDSESEELTIPAEISIGTYYIIFSGDNDDELDEVNEGNNTTCVEIIVTNTLSVKDVTLENPLKIFPNPTRELLTINLPDTITNESIEVIIYTINGEQVFTGKQIVANATFTIDVQSFSNGIYLLHVMHKHKKWAKLFIKK